MSDLSSQNRTQCARRFPIVKCAIAFVLLTIVFLSYMINKSLQSEPQSRILLVDGDCEVVEAVSHTKFRIHMVDVGDSNKPATEEFTLNLAGISDDTKSDLKKLEALEFVRAFVDGKLLSVRFDRNRYDHNHQVYGYLFADELLLNVELVVNGYAAPAPISGNSNAIQSRIRQAMESRSGPKNKHR